MHLLNTMKQVLKFFAPQGVTKLQDSSSFTNRYGRGVDGDPERPAKFIVGVENNLVFAIHKVWNLGALCTGRAANHDEITIDLIVKRCHFFECGAACGAIWRHEEKRRCLPTQRVVRHLIASRSGRRKTRNRRSRNRSTFRSGRSVVTNQADDTNEYHCVCQH